MSLKNPVTPPGIDPGTVRLVAQRLNHYATPGPLHVTRISLWLLFSHFPDLPSGKFLGVFQPKLYINNIRLPRMILAGALPGVYQ